MSVPFDINRLDTFGPVGDAALGVADGLVNQQAAMISYLNDFLMMAIACWAAIPVLFFLRAGKPTETIEFKNGATEDWFAPPPGSYTLELSLVKNGNAPEVMARTEAAIQVAERGASQ